MQNEEEEFEGKLLEEYMLKNYRDEVLKLDGPQLIRLKELVKESYGFQMYSSGLVIGEILKRI